MLYIGSNSFGLGPELKKDFGGTLDKEQAVSLMKQNGIKYVVYSLKSKSIKKVKRMMPGLLEFQKALNKEGISLSFHNHRFEYMDDHGSTVMDYLFANGLNAELDVGWATYVDKDPVKIIKEHGSQLPLIHIKDIAKKGKKVHGKLCVAPGQGIIDLEAILLACKDLKDSKLLVDQDDSLRGDVIGDIKEAVEAFEKILA